MTRRETILQALLVRLQTISGSKVLRNDALPERIHAGGLIILRDGDPGEPEVMLSPLSYYWQHKAMLEVVVQHGDPNDRNAALDRLFEAIAAVIAEDPTLGGLCDRVIPQAPSVSALAVEGAPQIAAALVPIELIYTTDDQLG